MLWFWLAVLIGAIYVFGGVSVWLVFHVEERAFYQEQINERFEQVMQKSWTCWRCGWPSPGERPRPLCLCAECLDMYLQEVA